ncbi:MAG: EF-Tu/IF-2/RF-3 family GTPase, partial [Candidatus Marinimicrobia bacterium]|nr:EF-Tu/IF-2/RF-3 family GTPase [Candidatus Neomarinimicrobiota bacterium]
LYDGTSLGTQFFYAAIPDDLKDIAAQYRQKLIEEAANYDDVIFAKYLNAEEITAEELRNGLRKGTLENKIVPVLCGSAFRNKGVQRLLDAIINFLPSPFDVPPIEGINLKGTPVKRYPRAEDPLSALIFKIMTDQHVGRLCFIRIYSGAVNKGEVVYNPIAQKKERIGRLLLMHANKREDREILEAGEIGAVVGLKYSYTGHTICDPKNPVILESMEFPEPVIKISIEPKSKADSDNLINSMNKLAEEDPTFQISIDEETGQTLVSGMGELHLEILVERLVREFKVKAHIGKPQVSYRETVISSAQGEGRFIRQTGNKNQFAVVRLLIEPDQNAGDVRMENKIIPGTLPKEFIPAIEKGVRNSAKSGVLAGYPLQKIKIIIMGSEYRDEESTELAFEVAAAMAVEDALHKAEPALLEPIMALEVVVPDEYLGDVLNDLNIRRAEIVSMNKRSEANVIDAKVPLREMFGYATDLRSISQGRAVFTMKFSQFDYCEKKVQREIIQKTRGFIPEFLKN